MKLKELPIGAVVVDSFSGYRFFVADQSFDVYPGTVLLSEQILRCAPMDAAEPEYPAKNVFDFTDRYGCNRYDYSNIHQWLNKAETFWWKPTHSTDAAPENHLLRYGEQSNLHANGFLRHLSSEFMEQLLEVDVPTLIREGKGKGNVHSVKARFFLPSRTELGLGDESGYAEGKPLPLFVERNHLRCTPLDSQMEMYGRSWNPGYGMGLRTTAKLDDAQIFDPKYSWWYWCRTPHLTYSYLERVMNANGGFSYTFANNDIVGVRPMCVMNPEAEIADEMIQ